ncbi:MAG: CDP-diacylglycerol--serine O-phosphatidyltransferase [Bdellovibrionales bacterium]|nr:CDP-diacylglycerol--serine O-phosphatidyltransferase [Bdellovibrionales bacterium]
MFSLNADKNPPSEGSGERKRFHKLNQRTIRLRRRLTMHIYILPNLLTTMNMFFGFFAIIYGIKGNFVFAAYAIVAAAVFDLLDGRVARLTHSTSEFGAQYDSLSDLVSFGIAPGLLLFQWAIQPFGRIGWLASFFYVACGALRLARFNVQKNIVEKAYFQGLPIPMAAGIVASSILAFQDLELVAYRSPWILAMTFLLGFVMVSTFRYRSFKDIELKQRLPFTYLVLGVFLFALVAIRPEVMLFVLFLSYAILGAVFGVLRLGRPLKKRMPEFVEDTSVVHEDDLHEEVEEEP